MNKYIKSLGIINCVFMNLLLLFYVFLLPYLADFYLLEPTIPFQEFYFKYIDNRYYIFEIIIISLTLISILCITGKVGAAMIVTGLPMMLLAYASSIKFTARNELLHLDDLKLTEAAGMAANFLNFEFSPLRIKVIIIIFLFFACGITADIFYKKFSLTELVNKKDSPQIPRIMRWVMCCICVTAMICYSNIFMHSTQNVMSVENGQLINEGYDRFVLYSFLKNEKNINITAGDIEKSYDYFLSNEAPDTYVNNKIRPTIIVIMNESWWDLDNRIGDNIMFSIDPMQPYHELSEKCSSGYLSTNIYGGGTISSEIEFLTGINTKYLLSDVGIYVETRSHKIPSIVEYFDELDYHTTAIHPYYGEFYSRNKTYSQMGFDKVIFEDDMDYTEIYTRYISDESLACQIIKEYEDEQEGSGRNQFIFAVSIANHNRSLHYKYEAVEEYHYPVEVTVKDQGVPEAEQGDLVNTVNGIYLANMAFAQLVDHFEQKEEPVIIVMYGDHIPFFSRSVLKALGLEGNEYEKQRCQYSVPILMWSNFIDQKIDFTGENINYLPQILLEYTGMPKTDMTQILQQERKYFKTDVRRFMEDSDGEQIKVYTDKQIEMVKHMNIIDYDMLFGDSSRREKLWQPHGAGEYISP